VWVGVCIYVSICLCVFLMCMHNILTKDDCARFLDLRKWEKEREGERETERECACGFVCAFVIYIHTILCVRV